MKWLFLFPIAAVLLAGCSAQHEEMVAKQDVLKRLKDPGSAVFRNIRSKESTSAGKAWNVVCGEVNSKNSYGGYVGFESFVWYDGDLYMGDDAAAWMVRCPS